MNESICSPDEAPDEKETNLNESICSPDEAPDEKETNLNQSICSPEEAPDEKETNLNESICSPDEAAPEDNVTEEAENVQHDSEDEDLDLNKPLDDDNQKNQETALSDKERDENTEDTSSIIKDVDREPVVKQVTNVKMTIILLNLLSIFFGSLFYNICKINPNIKVYFIILN